MGSAGLEFDADDQPEKTRLNQKTTFVGTGGQINGLSITYPGQRAYCTASGSGFTVDIEYMRNASNTAWVSAFTFNDAVTETSETNTTPVTDNADFTAVIGTRYYAFFTLPTTDPLYIITGIEWKNGDTVNGNIICGIDLVDTIPPTLTTTPLLVFSTQVAQSGVNTTQRNSNISTTILRGGTICGVWVSCSSGTAKLREQTGLGSQNQSKATTYNNSPSAADATAWTSTTSRKYLKVYYRSYY